METARRTMWFLIGWEARPRPPLPAGGSARYFQMRTHGRKWLRALSTWGLLRLATRRQRLGRSLASRPPAAGAGRGKAALPLQLARRFPPCAPSPSPERGPGAERRGQCLEPGAAVEGRASLLWDSLPTNPHSSGARPLPQGSERRAWAGPPPQQQSADLHESDYTSGAPGTLVRWVEGLGEVLVGVAFWNCAQEPMNSPECVFSVCVSVCAEIRANH